MGKWGLLTVLTTILVLSGCPNPVLGGGGPANQAASGPASGVCLNCHNASYGFVGAAAANLVGYSSSGHANGLRVLNSDGTYGISQWPDEGTKASCTKCHSGDGFVSWTIHPGAVSIGATTVPTDIANTSTTVSAGNHVSCYACHNPHANWNMDPRIDYVVALGSGMSGVGTTATTLSTNAFSGGAGNLCANCHQDRTDNTARNTFVSATFAAGASSVTSRGVTTYYNNLVTTAVAAGGSTHHGVQSDFLMGKDSAGYISGVAPTGVMYNGYKIGGPPPTTTPTFATTHYSSNFKATSTGTNDSCVICHVNLNTKNATGQVTSHAMYLTDNVTGDNVAVCAVCHNAATGTTVSHNSNTGSNSFQTFVPGHSYLADIDTAKNTLLAFFGNPAYFYTITYADLASGTLVGDPIVIGPAFGATNGAVQACTTAAGNASLIAGQYTPGATWVWKKDWEFASVVYMTINEQQALWNLRLFSEDRSNGVHNPQYAAELLYDAITLINNDTGSGGVRAGPLTSNLPYPTDWASRP